MKIVQEDSSKIIFKENSSAGISLFFLIFTIPFMLVPNIDASVTNIKCDRHQFKEIICRKNQYKLMGLLPQEPQTVGQVLGAKDQTSDTIDSEDGRLQNNFLELQTKTGSVKFIEDKIYINGVKGNQAEMIDIAAQINKFVQSQATALSITKDNRWNFVNLGLLGFFTLIDLTLINLIFDRRSLTLDKNNGTFIEKETALLTRKNKVYPLSDIKRVDVRYSKDSYSNFHYQPTIILHSGQMYKLMSDTNPQPIQDLANRLNQFLGVYQQKSPFVPESGTTDKPLFLAEDGSLNNLIFQGAKDAYYGEEIKDISAEETTKIQEVNRELTFLGYDILGKIEFAYTSNLNLQLYIYIKPQENYYASVIKYKEKAICEFVSKFSNGAYLVTTNLPNAVKNKKLQIFGNSYPDLEIAQMQIKHQQQLNKLMANNGYLERVSDDLLSITKWIDDYYTKHRKELWGSIKFMTNVMK